MSREDTLRRLEHVCERLGRLRVEAEALQAEREELRAAYEQDREPRVTRLMPDSPPLEADEILARGMTRGLRETLDKLRAVGRPSSVREVAALLGIAYDPASVRLGRLVKLGVAERVFRGVYRPTVADGAGKEQSR